MRRNKNTKKNLSILSLLIYKLTHHTTTNYNYYDILLIFDTTLQWKRTNKPCETIHLAIVFIISDEQFELDLLVGCRFDSDTDQTLAHFPTHMFSIPVYFYPHKHTWKNTHTHTHKLLIRFKFPLYAFLPSILNMESHQMIIHSSAIQLWRRVDEMKNMSHKLLEKKWHCLFLLLICHLIIRFLFRSSIDASKMCVQYFLSLNCEYPIYWCDNALKSKKNSNFL